MTPGPGGDDGTPEAASAAPVDGPVEQRVTRFLVAHGAAELPHPGGTLLAHLRRTHHTLVAWDAPRALALAGLGHAVYGTDGFPHPLVAHTRRKDVIDLVGAEAEAIVHRYACCDRANVEPQLGRRRPVAFRDRFTGATTDLDGDDLSSFVELTVANELDVLAHHHTLTDEGRAALADLLTRCRSLVSPPAAAAIDSAFPDAESVDLPVAVEGSDRACPISASSASRHRIARSSIAGEGSTIVSPTGGCAQGCRP